jgi:predicted PolB exonuclease-like 3'-5' exonuclease
MLNNLKLDHVLVIDIETVPQEESFALLNSKKQELWDLKSRYQRKDNQTAEEFYDKAGIWAEFGKIICISVGIFHLKRKQVHLRVNSFASNDEKSVLKQFIALLNNKEKNILCAHNGKEFDFPYLCRRLLINNLAIPETLQIAGKKPWEVNHIDTMELWKFGDYKSYTSLELLAAVFDLPTPKCDLDGSKVKDVYYKEKDLPRISRYCEADVITTAQILLRFKGLSLIPQENITLVR